MKRTIENCSLIKRCVSDGIGKPNIDNTTENINKCEGYQVSEYDDEPCEICKKCKYCTMGEMYDE